MGTHGLRLNLNHDKERKNDKERDISKEREVEEGESETVTSGRQREQL